MGLQNSVSNMYPQIYRIIDPVANRVIANNNYPYYTEDNINNMVDTVYNIVEGDISTLSSTVPVNSSDDLSVQNSSRNSNSSAGNNNQRTNTSEVVTRNVINENQLLKDLIKIIIIKQILSKQNNFNPIGNMNCCNQRYMGWI